MAATIEERVRKIIKQEYPQAKDITLETHLYDDLKGDSLDFVECIMALEEEFEDDQEAFCIPDEDAEQLFTVGSIIKYLEQRLKK